MPRPLPDRKRAAILADIEAGQKSRNQIARDHGVSVSTVTKLAPPGSFDRSQTKNATAAAVADNRRIRAQISRRLLTKANELLNQMDQPHIVFNIGGKDNVYTEHLMDRPPTTDLRNLMTSAAVAIDKHAVLEKLDSDTGADQARSMLGALAEGLAVAADHLNGTGGE